MSGLVKIYTQRLVPIDRVDRRIGINPGKSNKVIRYRCNSHPLKIASILSKGAGFFPMKQKPHTYHGRRTRIKEPIGPLPPSCDFNLPRRKV